MTPVVPIRVRLDAAERRRASRHVILDDFGLAAQSRLASARVVVVGAGGLGSPVLQYLAAAGVGTIGIIDDDAVSVSNLGRQVLHGAASVGVLKTDSAAATLRRLRPEAQIIEHTLRLTADTAEAILGAYDLVVDACDTFETRYLVGAAATRLGLPVVWGTVLGWDGLVSVWWADAPGGGLTYAEVFGEQPPEGATCETAGVLGPACGVVGSTMAVEAVKLLTGTGTPAIGRLLAYDARTSTWDSIDVQAPLAEEVSPNIQSAIEGLSGDSQVELESLAAPLILDVGLVSWQRPGEVWVRLEDIIEGNLPDVLLEHPVDAPVITVCEYGLRARGAATVLKAEGWANTLALSRPEMPPAPM
jgi:adenylyltransferase/sulfurtransferase